MSKYYLILGKVNIGRADKIRDCQSNEIEQAEQEAIEELDKQLATGNEDAIVRVVEADSRLVVFGVHKGNIDNVRYKIGTEVYKLVTNPIMSIEDWQKLQSFGCDEQPFIKTSSYSVYKMDIRPEDVEEVRKIGSVQSIDPMPKYS